MNNKKLLPLGSIIYLQEGTQKLMIVGRGVIFDDEETGEQVFADYMGVLCLDTDSFSQSVLDQCLMCFRKSKLPRKSGIMDRTSRCCSCTSVITGDQNQSGPSFCNTSCNRSDTGFRYQFDRNSCILVCIFTVIDQLCQIFDRVNIVMRRR